MIKEIFSLQILLVALAAAVYAEPEADASAEALFFGRHYGYRRYYGHPYR